MRVTPLDIRKQEFRRVMRGLDTDEVYAFLQTVADEYEAVLSDNKNLRERMVELEDRLKEYKTIETNLRNTLLTAEKITAEAKENARREASLIVREAEVDADKAAEAIRAHTMQLRREILELKKQKDNYITRLKTLLDNHRKVLEGFEEDFSEVDRAIERIGDQVEMDIKQPSTPPRMSRKKITEDVVTNPTDKVTWDDERKREDEPRPSMPRPEWQGQRRREVDTAPAGDEAGDVEKSEVGTSSTAAGRKSRSADARRTPAQRAETEPVGTFGARGAHDHGADSSAGTRAHGDAAAYGESRPRGDSHRIGGKGAAGGIRPDAHEAGTDQQGAGSVVTVAPPVAAERGPDARVELKTTQDDWKHYEVREQKTDWAGYDVPRSPNAGAPKEPPAKRAPRTDRAKAAAQTVHPDVAEQAAPASDNEVEAALAGLNEMRHVHADRPGDVIEAGVPETETATAEKTPPDTSKQDKKSNGFWSMDQLRKNLSNFIGGEEEGGEQGEV